MRAHRWQALLCVAALMLVGCDERASRAPRDGGPDGMFGDARADASREGGAADLSDDAPKDAGPDFPSLPEAGFDFPISDAPLSGATVLYLLGKGVTEVGFRTVPANGSAEPVPVAAFPGRLALDELKIAGQRSRLPLRSDLPRVAGHGFPRLRLPDGSSLFYLHRSLVGTSALLRVDPSGALDVLLELPGLYSTTLGEHLAFDASAAHAALVAGAGAQLFWVKVDGATFPGGERALPIALPANVKAIHDASLRVVGGQLFCVAELHDGHFSLLAASISPSVAPAAALPIDGATSMAFIDDDLVVEPSGTALLLGAATDTSGVQHLYRLEVVTGASTRLTSSAKVMLPAAGVQRRRALSATHVAYLAEEGGAAQLHFAPARANADALLISGARFFQLSAATVLEGFVFEADDVLLFWAGINAAQLDLYRYDGGSDTIENLTSPAALEPFDGQGVLGLRTLQRDAAGLGFYFIGESYFDGHRNLFFYPFGGPGRQLSSGIRLSDRPSDFAHCAADGAFYALALPRIGRSQLEVFAGSLSSDLPLSRVTNLAGVGPWSVADLQLQGDCATLLFAAGPFTGDRRLWALDTASQRAWPITPVPRFIGPWPLVTPDGSTTVYASGGAPEAMTLKAARAIGGGEITLDTQAGQAEPLAVYP